MTTNNNSINDNSTNNSINDNSINDIDLIKLEKEKEKKEKLKKYKKMWTDNNLDKMAYASRKYYDAKKNDPEFIQKRLDRYRMKREDELKRREQEKLLNPPPSVEQEPEKPKERKTLGRPRKYL
jgi:hypothetical protein